MKRYEIKARILTNFSRVTHFSRVIEAESVEEAEQEALNSNPNLWGIGDEDFEIESLKEIQ